ncbi:MAG: hypothetical protein ACI80S_000721 [Pseudohongiellaceae bacterium]|jgi:hypothetical protein
MTIINSTIIIKYFIKASLLIAILAEVVFFSANTSALTLTVETDKISMTKTEILNLIISADDNANDEIDFTQLSYEFDIISNQRSSRLTISNGRKIAKTFWVLILAPKETGKLTIPSFNYKNVISSSITIDVIDSVGIVDNNTDSPDVFFELSADKKIAYVQEQIVVTARLYYKIALANYEHEGLKVNNTRVEQVFEKNKTVTFQGQRYKLLEEVYTLHPQASGKLIIPVQTWRLEKPSRRFGYSNPINPYVYVRSEEITLDVLATPESKTSDSAWLPSKNITLSAQWKQAPLQAIVGEPLNLQIAITAQGLADYQLPNLSIEASENFTIFEALPETNNIKDSQGVIGIRKLNYSVIPRATGQFTLPEVSISWWNVETNKAEMATLSEQTVIVARSGITGNTVESNQALPLLNSLAKTTTEKSGPIILWQVISSLFLVVICVLFYKLYQTKKSQVSIKNAATQNFYSNLLGSRKKTAIHKIETHIENKNWQQLRREVINWGQLTLDDEALDTLNNLALKIPELALHLQQLDVYLYKQPRDENYKPQQLLALIKKYKSNIPTSKKSRLRDIY